MEDGESASAASRAARKLGDLFASIEVQADWLAVEKNAQLLANELRVQSGPGEPSRSISAIRPY